MWACLTAYLPRVADMGSTLDGSRLKQITVSGSKLSDNLTNLCIGASFSLSNSQTTEMQMTFQDTQDADLFTSRIFHRGASIRYGDWQLVSHGVRFTPGKLGPTLQVTAPSRFVVALKKQTGAKSWGSTSVTAWVQSVAASVGMKSLVQPGLGTKTIARQAPAAGEQPESTWDLLAQQAREVGVWLYEYGTTLVFAKPSYLVKASWPRKTWALRWDDWLRYSAGLAGMPVYADDPDGEYPETLTLKLVSPDADTARVGDAVVLSGANVGPMGGTWIINGVGFPMKAADVVTVTCQRPIDPTPEPPQDTAKAETGNKVVTGRNPYAQKAPAATGIGGALGTWANGVNGRAIDMDGAYGAQCVDLANHYHIYCVGGGSQVIANGNQWFANAPDSLYSKVTGTAMAGDIACWNGFYGGGYGHVAIVLEDLGGSLKVMTQNPGPANITTLSKQGIQGYLRPKKVVQAGNGSRGPVKVV
ncbi:minor tail protein [Arthrobacter phage Jinkies]|uniref:Minor tail protein n=1 Tax=Arthrobacter phage Jinkies TaxID=2743903 RepID=A0A7S5WS10_9CAUD|nr:minor tail protein [Arthrobacter phage Jinkies]